jgi:hypothetical protein
LGAVNALTFITLLSWNSSCRWLPVPISLAIVLLM